MTRDEKIQDIAVHYLGFKSPPHFEFTLIGILHPRIHAQFSLEEGELVIVSAFYSEQNWYVFTTRRSLAVIEGGLVRLIRHTTLKPILETSKA